MRGMRHNVDDRCNGRFQSQGQKRPDGCGYGHDNDGDKGKDEDDNDDDGLGDQVSQQIPTMVGICQ